jgi:hypothetical protein
VTLVNDESMNEDSENSRKANSGPRMGLVFSHGVVGTVPLSVDVKDICFPSHRIYLLHYTLGGTEQFATASRNSRLPFKRFEMDCVVFGTEMAKVPSRRSRANPQTSICSDLSHAEIC